MYDLGLINGNVYIDGNFKKINIYMKNEKIAKISKRIFPTKNIVDCFERLILPGFIDPHVHFNLNLGEFTSSDDFHSGSIAAAYGGVTTFIDFLDPILDNSQYNEKLNSRLSLASDSVIDYSFHATLGNYQDDVNMLKNLVTSSGITSVKVFTTYSESNRQCSENIISELFETPLTILSHTENDDLVDSSWKTISDYESSRPVQSELEEAKKLASLVHEKNGKLYFVHISSGSTVDMLKNSFGNLLNKNIFIESCPHYFYLSSSAYKNNDSKNYLLAPPLRSSEEIIKLRNNIDTIFSIGTDHCPFMSFEKDKYSTADLVPKGIGSIEYSFLLMYSLFGEKVIDLFTKNPASRFNLNNKGSIKKNNDADLVILNPNEKTTIDSGHSKCDYSPYSGTVVNGKIESTIIRGNFVIKNGTLMPTVGKFIRRVL